MKFKSLNLDVEDAGFQDGENFSELDSGSDTNESTQNGGVTEDSESVALRKRIFVLKELIQTEQDYVHDLEFLVDVSTFGVF